MRKLLIATHGHFAAGIKETMDFILGDTTNTEVICAYVESGFDMNKEVERVISNLDNNDELIVFVDLIGGSVSNAFSTRISDSRIHLISGVNVPMLIEIATSLDSEDDIRSIIESSIHSGREGINYVNDIIKQASESEEEDEF